MSTQLTKTEKLIAGVIFAAIAAFIFMFMQISQRSGAKISSQFETTHAIDYKMARPEQLYSEYTLEGRELEQSYEALTPAEQKLSRKKQALIAKAKIETKKKAEIKKKQVAAATAKAKAMAKTRAQVAAAARESQLAKFQGKTSAENARTDQTQPYNSDYNPAAQPPGDSVAPLVKSTSKKSFAEWRTLIFDKPTAETMGLFIAAYRKNEVTMTEYQALAQDLLDQTEPKLKGLGLMALRSVPSLQSYSQLVHAQASLNETYQAYVEQSLLSYLQPHNLTYLIQAIGTRDKLVLMKSLTLLNINLTKLSQGDQSGFIDPRSRREDSNVTLSMASFRGLLPNLGQIGSSQDQELSGLAQQIVTLIQSANHVAQN